SSSGDDAAHSPRDASADGLRVRILAPGAAELLAASVRPAMLSRTGSARAVVPPLALHLCQPPAPAETRTRSPRGTSHRDGSGAAITGSLSR
ncbi:hypothetical protein OFN63_31415, partial [Escherichia coli]|nr:hypothetical protein [Escherichia coli]